mmetsp:Transcript_9907/g.23443  ORF Transcript_9907/g.23443 Transcript_9907/m.23443 type:complete len:141 (+) Transcript_9907:265-687(+)
MDTNDGEISNQTPFIHNGNRIPPGITHLIFLPSEDWVRAEPFFCLNRLVTVTLQNGIKKIGAEVFRLCKSLREISIPISVEIIEPNAFSYCESLENIELHEGLCEIMASRPLCTAHHCLECPYRPPWRQSSAVSSPNVNL